MCQGVRDKKVLITGASGAIGACTARLLASHGAAVGLHYHTNRRAAQLLCCEIRRLGGIADCFPADLVEHATACRLIRAFTRRFKRIDVLINNAGAVLGHRPMTELDERSWDATFALNVKAPFFLAQEAFRWMRRHGGGKIINISSVAAKYGGSPTTTHYGAAKAALEAVTVGLARLGAPRRILVNAIRPGFIDTPFHRKMGRTDLASRIRLIPLQRAGQPLDVARLALYLVSEGGDYITGEVFTVSGGD